MPDVVTGPIWVEVLQAGQPMTFTMEASDGTSKAFSYTWTDADLTEMVETYDPVRLTEGTLGVDHRKGGPAYGWFSALKKDGARMFAELCDLQAIAAEAIQSKAYKHLSSEVDWDYKGTGKKYFLGATLLGLSNPASAGMQPIMLADGSPKVHCAATSTQIAHCATDVQKVEIVYPSDDYQPGDLQQQLLDEQNQNRASTILDRARDIIQGIWWSITLTPAEKLARAQQVLADATPLLANPSIIPDEGDDMTEAQMAQFATAVATATAQAVTDTLSTRDAALVATLAAAQTTATADTTATAELDTAAAQFAAAHLPPAADAVRVAALAAAYKAAVALDTDGSTGHVAALAALVPAPAGPPQGEAAPNAQHATVEGQKYILKLADGSTTRVSAPPFASEDDKKHIADAVQYANTHGVPYDEALIATLPALA